MPKPVILSTSELARSRLFRIDSLSIRFGNGKLASFECMRKRNPGVVMVAALSGDDLVLVREYAAGFDRYELGFVKGRIDDGETASQAAGREMIEETGFRPGKLEWIRKVSTSPGYSDFTTDLFLASDLQSCRMQGGDEIEPLEQVRWPMEEIAALQGHPEVTDARSLFLIQYLERKFTPAGCGIVAETG